MNQPDETSKGGTAANDGSAGAKRKTPQPPDAPSDRAAPGPSRAPEGQPGSQLPIAEIEEEEDDAKGG